jgi:hypothetical protein
MNTQEYWEKQVLFASRQKLPAGYGFYFPAKDDHEDEETSNSMMVCISFTEWHRLIYYTPSVP